MAHRETLDPRFADYVTRVAFNLTLSRGQITALAIIKSEIDQDARRRKARKPKKFLSLDNPPAPRFSHFVPAVQGLERRGLVVWEDPSQMKPRWDHCPFKLTRAGELVYQLLETAGLVRNADGYYANENAA